MTYKVVQTIENSKIVLTCVPHQWERNGVLYWPKKHQQPHKLQKDEDSQPDNTWDQLMCAVKRRNMKTYQDAINEIDIMSNNSDTESDVHNVSIKKRRKCLNIPQQQSYNIMAEESLKNLEHNASSRIMPKAGNNVANNVEIKGNILIKKNAVTNQSPDNTAEPMTVASDEITTTAASVDLYGTVLSAPKENTESYVVIPKSKQPDMPIIYSYDNKETSQEQCDLRSIQTDINTIKSDLKSINGDIQTMMETLNIIINNQTIIHDGLQPIMTKVTELQVQNEGFIKRAITEKRNHSLGLKQIKQLKDLEEFEKQLIDSDYREDLQRKLSVLCSRGVGKGTTSAYTIIDIMFDRQFFKSCSWTGASRSKDEQAEKICFKSFSKTISLVFDTIHQTDSSFNLIDCHKFFKTILRNAEQRSKIDPKRASAKKCRGKTSDKNTSSEKLVTNETPSTQPPIDEQIGGNQNMFNFILEDVSP